MNRFLGLVALAACTLDAPAKEHDVDWVPRDTGTINYEACTGIRVLASRAFGPSDIIELSCDATSTVVVSDPDDPLVEIEVDYLLWWIPLDCGSEECWEERTMATGSAEFQAAGTTIVVAPLIQSPI